MKWRKKFKPAVDMVGTSKRVCPECLKEYTVKAPASWSIYRLCDECSKPVNKIKE